MSISHHAGNTAGAKVVSPETMYRVIREMGMVPFFENHIPGYSIEECTPPEFWFDGDSTQLGPWDWKIDVLHSGDIAYGKFLLGGKASFATVRWYRELVNWRRSRPESSPGPDGETILSYVASHGAVSIREVRALLGVKKSAADSAIARLMHQCRLVTGDIVRVYRGEDLHYNGWQTSSFCTPDALFADDSPLPGPVAMLAGFSSGLEVNHSPEESYRRLFEHIRSLCPGASDKDIIKVLK